MGQVLYRDYRPKTLKDVIGQEHITKSLQHALDSGKIAHAYLFTGPRGVGKTSVARILAYNVNKLPYDDSHAQLDIIEIDAASNRRIDEIRYLRDKVNLTPSSAAYKVYIIDEVHMLTREAFNALLKTLEEPPAHVIFILATTEAHKLPETIISRTQRYTFKPVPIKQVIDHLQEIAKKEHIKVDSAALELIAKHGEGSFRDSISLLDQLRHQDDMVTLSDVQTMLGIAPDDAIALIVNDLADGNHVALLRQLGELYEQGYSASILAHQVGERLRQMLLDQAGQLEPDQIMTILRALIDVPAASTPESSLEVGLLSTMAFQKPTTATIHQAPSVPEVTAKIKEPEPTTAQPLVAEVDQQISAAPSDEPLSLALWPSIIETVKKQHNTLYSVIRMAAPVFDGDTLMLKFAFKFHQKRLDEAKNKATVVAIIKQLTGKEVTISSIVEKDAEPPVFPKSQSIQSNQLPDDSLETINNIFGGSEVLES